MIAFVVLLAMWPFHHKTKPQPDMGKISSGPIDCAAGTHVDGIWCVVDGFHLSGPCVIADGSDEGCDPSFAKGIRQSGIIHDEDDRSCDCGDPYEGNPIGDYSPDDYISGECSAVDASGEACGPIIDINGAHYPGLADDWHPEWTLPEDESPPACEKSGKLWFYTEGDGFIGFSDVSCAGAYYNQKNMHVDPVKTKLG